MSHKVSAAEAKTHLSELLSRVATNNERIVIERRGKPVAALISILDLSTLPSIPSVSMTETLRELAKLPTVPDEELDAAVKFIYAERHRGLESDDPPK